MYRSPSSRARRSRLGIALAFLALGPAAAAAQNCLGLPLSGNQKSFGMAIDDQLEFGGVGGWYAETSKSGGSGYLDFMAHEIEVGSAEYEYMTSMNLRGAKPVLRSASVNEQPNGTCALFELGMTTFQEANSYRFGGGLGYALTMGRVALFAAPMFGLAMAEGYNDSYVNVLAGGSIRLGFLVAGAQTLMPMQPEGGKQVLAVRFGFAWGRASEISTAPAPSAGAAPGVIGAAAAAAAAGSAGTPAATQAGAPANPAGAPGPTAGLKPYAIEDIEAMVRNNVASARILDLVYKACIDFRMDEAMDTRLRRSGADQGLIDGLRTRCYLAS